MSRKKKIGVGIVCFFLTLAYAVFTWGVIFYDYRTFGGQDDIILAEGLKSDLYIDSGFVKHGAVPIGHYFRTEALPYPLRVQIWDDERLYASINVKTVSIAYLSGKEVRKEVNWVREIVPDRRHYYSKEEGSVYDDIRSLSDYISGVVEAYEDCIIRLDGFLVTVSGEKKSFSASVTFEYEHKRGISTFLEYIASV